MSRPLVSDPTAPDVSAPIVSRDLIKRPQVSGTQEERAHAEIGATMPAFADRVGRNVEMFDPRTVATTEPQIRGQKQ